ncbi:MAG TPA: HEAT repeat domain-containing protein [Trichocoleus sp.]
MTATIDQGFLQAYLQSLRTTYQAKQTLLGRSISDLPGIMVRVVPLSQPDAEPPTPPEILPASLAIHARLNGATLLVGASGTGKTTLLMQTLLGVAEETSGLLPVLVNLRNFGTSIVDLIQSELTHWGLELSQPEIEALLSQKKLLVLLDDVTALPQVDMSDLKIFCQTYPNSPLILTAQNFSSSRFLRVRHLLEIQPLSVAQAAVTAQAIVPNADVLLEQLANRPAYFRHVPLLLSLCCRVFQHTQTIPITLGLLFRQFQQLPQGETDVDRAALYRWFQNYDTAEALLSRWSELSDETLQHYLNCRDWTPTFQIILSLLETKTEILRLVNLAIEIDPYLAATLAGSTHPEFQPEALDRIARLNLPPLFKLDCLSKTQSPTVIPALVAALADPALQDKAAIALERFKSEAAVPGLLQCLNHPNPTTRMRASELLGQIDSAAAMTGLFQALTDTEGEVRWRAAWALGQRGNPRAIPVLLKALPDENAAVRWRIAVALKQLGNEAAIPDLLQGLTDTNHQSRWNAAWALGQLKSSAAVPGLIKALADADTNVRWIAAEALAKLPLKATIVPLLKALSDPRSVVHESAAWVLGIRGNAAALPNLLKALTHPDFLLRQRAAEALGNLGDSAAIPGLVAALTDRHPSVRNRATEALIKLNRSEAIPDLVECLHHDKAETRARAAEILGSFDLNALPHLAEALTDSSPLVRSKAAAGLGQLGGRASLPHLLRALKDPDSQVRWKAAGALGKLDDSAACAPLITALTERDASVRWSAAWAIGQLGCMEAIESLFCALNDEHPLVREKAATAIGNLGTADLIPRLQKLAGLEPALQQAIIRSIQESSGVYRLVRPSTQEI